MHKPTKRATFYHQTIGQHFLYKRQSYDNKNKQFTGYCIKCKRMQKNNGGEENNVGVSSSEHQLSNFV
jgi:hypothetical protein